MPTPVTRANEDMPFPPDQRWLPVGDLPLENGETATVSFDREGRCRLLLVLDRPAREADVRALEEAADALPYLQLGDLEGGAGYPDRHAEAFALAQPLGGLAFNSSARVELVSHQGGSRLPARLGGFGLATRTVLVPEAPPEEGPAAVEAEAPPTTGEAGGARASRLDGRTLALVLLGVLVGAFVVVFVRQVWSLHQHFGTYGFDLGIYQQGTWLLSRLRAPFVTVRGLNLFGEHASYILILVAPLYRAWSDPRLLLLLQVIALAVPAVVVHLLAVRHLGSHLAGLAVAAAYLAYPAMQWALTWQFHPESLAAAFLALAALAADRQRPRQMAVWLGLALLCREDVGLVVAGFGGLLVLTGRRRDGWRVVFAGLVWWMLTTYLLIPLTNGRQTNLFELNYGITGLGPFALLRALPSMTGRALATALSNEGLSYLLLVLVPLLGLPLLAPRALLPVAPALFLNLAALPPEQHQIRFQYLATSAPLLAVAAVAGLAMLAARRRRLLVPALVALVLVAGFMGYRYGPAPWSKDAVAASPSPSDPAKRAALAMIPPDAPVSAQFNLVPQVANRARVFEFPNPFRAVNWGLAGDAHPARDLEELRYVLVDRGLLDQDQRALIQDLQSSPDWATRYDASDVVLLERRGAGS